MKHLGDITKINGAEIEPVDVCTFGAPCQDLSVAGRRKGMLHEGMGDEETTRSGLFYEAIRIIKEMRDADKKRGRTGEAVRCRYGVYENVPGALSSNNGEDWRCVLEETAKVIQKDAVIPRPEGKWPNSGCIMLDNGSIAWRTVDAQWWGTPQRRKRICMLADFNGHTAPWILFDAQYRRTPADPESDQAFGNFGTECRQEIQSVEPCMSGHPGESGTKREETSGDIEEGT